MDDIIAARDGIRSSDPYVLIPERREIITGSWTENLFGEKLSPNRNASYNEKISHTRNLPYNPKNGTLFIDSRRGVGGRYLDAGIFVYPSVSQIIADVTKYGVRGDVSVSVVQGKDASDLHLECNPLECIQAASQFNALEMPGPSFTPLDGIEGYKDDNTQGPIVAMTCAAGTYVRNYIQPAKSLSQFNALADFGLEHINGYLIWGDKPEAVLSKIASDPNRLLVPCMLYTQVAGVKVGRGANPQMEIRIVNKKVHQIYSSSVPVNVYGNTGDTQKQVDIAYLLTMSAYIGAIGMAILLHKADESQGKPKVNLTLIGGGAFRVPIDVILRSLNDAIAMFKGIAVDIAIQAYAENEASTVRSQLAAIISPPRSPTPALPAFILHPPTPSAPLFTLPQRTVALPSAPLFTLPQRTVALPSAPLFTLPPLAAPVAPTKFVVREYPDGRMTIGVEDWYKDWDANTKLSRTVPGGNPRGTSISRVGESMAFNTREYVGYVVPKVGYGYEISPGHSGTWLMTDKMGYPISHIPNQPRYLMEGSFYVTVVDGKYKLGLSLAEWDAAFKTLLSDPRIQELKFTFTHHVSYEAVMTREGKTGTFAYGGRRFWIAQAKEQGYQLVELPGPPYSQFALIDPSSNVLSDPQIASVLGITSHA
jgi:hypothetical protein